MGENPANQMRGLIFNGHRACDPDRRQLIANVQRDDVRQHFSEAAMEYQSDGALVSWEMRMLVAAVVEFRAGSHGQHHTEL